MTKTPAYTELAAIYTRLHRFNHAAAILSWDRNAMMPPKGNAARAAATAELHSLIHGIRRDPRLSELIRRAEDEPLSDDERANLREIRRDWRDANALPETLVAAKTLAAARCEHAWRGQRPANDWMGFLENFRQVMHLAREEALRLAEATGLAPYDALVDRYEPGMTATELDRLFGDLRQWLPALIARVQALQRGDLVLMPPGPFAVPAQRALGLAVLALFGFDFGAGRLDESAHPFTGGVPDDVRLTTRYDENDFFSALRSTIHETGHGRYSQGLPRDWLGQPMGRARSFGIHESQSLFFEMQLSRHRGFLGLLPPLLEAHFGARPGFDADNLFRLATRVEPGRIRVEADELTYPIHIILRYEIERALIQGELEPDDIPAEWDTRMRELLGIDTRGDYRNGCLQDVHWSEGAFGYFPSYTLGAMYAAQWFAAVRRALPEIDARIAAGELQPVLDWLASRIWSQGSRWDTAALVRRASGEDLDPRHYRAHLEARYLGSP